jgi:hypothetical protein
MTTKDAIDYIFSLAAVGLLYHFDDSAEDCLLHKVSQQTCLGIEDNISQCRIILGERDLFNILLLAQDEHLS